MKNRFLAHSVLILSVFSTPLWSAAPSVINYAGSLSVQGAAYEGNGFFRFALVNFDCTDATSANISNCQTFWSNDGTSNQGTQPGTAVELIVSNGKFNVDLGDTSFSNMATINSNIMQQQLYLRTWFDDGKNGSEKLNPDYKLASVPYAINSKISELSFKATNSTNAERSDVADNAIGYNQSWQNMIAARKNNTVYHNNTNRPITVNASISLGDGAPVAVALAVGSANPPNVTVDSSIIKFGSQATVSGVIPPNHYYQVSTSTNLSHWSELR